jgi:3-methyladenine DNA glycosylase AlkD
MGENVSVDEIRERLRGMADPEKATVLRRFFKTGPGEYGEGDKFLGIVVPKLRKLASTCKGADEDFTLTFLHSEFHEERLFALLCLIAIYKKADNTGRDRVYEMYLANTHRINNWDLVDISAPYIVGDYLEKRPRGRLCELALSKSLWERRIAIVATFHFIRQNDLTDTLEIARMLLSDKEELIHKAAGWMLRETGKRDTAALVTFLEHHASSMPRTMLRYAIEKFLPDERASWLRQKTKISEPSHQGKCL